MGGGGWWWFGDHTQCCLGLTPGPMLKDHCWLVRGAEDRTWVGQHRHPTLSLWPHAFRVEYEGSRGVMREEGTYSAEGWEKNRGLSKGG